MDKLDKPVHVDHDPYLDGETLHELLCNSLEDSPEKASSFMQSCQFCIYIDLYYG